MKKRILSVLLVFALLLGILPAFPMRSAAAADPDNPLNVCYSPAQKAFVWDEWEPGPGETFLYYELAITINGEKQFSNEHGYYGEKYNKNSARLCEIFADLIESTNSVGTEHSRVQSQLERRGWCVDRQTNDIIINGKISAKLTICYRDVYNTSDFKYYYSVSDEYTINETLSAAYPGNVYNVYLDASDGHYNLRWDPCGTPEQRANGDICYNVAIYDAYKGIYWNGSSWLRMIRTIFPVYEPRFNLDDLYNWIKQNGEGRFSNVYVQITPYCALSGVPGHEYSFELYNIKIGSISSYKDVTWGSYYDDNPYIISWDLSEYYDSLPEHSGDTVYLFLSKDGEGRDVRPADYPFFYSEKLPVSDMIKGSRDFSEIIAKGGPGEYRALWMMYNYDPFEEENRNTLLDCSWSDTRLYHPSLELNLQTTPHVGPEADTIHAVTGQELRFAFNIELNSDLEKTVGRLGQYNARILWTNKNSYSYTHSYGSYPHPYIDKTISFSEPGTYHVALSGMVGDSSGAAVAYKSKTYTVIVTDSASSYKFLSQPGDMYLKNGEKLSFSWKANKTVTAAFLEWSYDQTTWKSWGTLGSNVSSGEYEARNAEKNSRMYFRLRLRDAVGNNIYSDPFVVLWTADGKEPTTVNMPSRVVINGSVPEFKVPFNYGGDNTKAKLYLLDENGNKMSTVLDHEYCSVGCSETFVGVSFWRDSFWDNSRRNFLLEITNTAGIPTQNVYFSVTWIGETSKVTFDMNGHGTAPADQIIDNGSSAARPETDPTAEGWTFGGWYQETACTNAYDFETPVTADITVYAKWTKNTTPPVFEFTTQPQSGTAKKSEGYSFSWTISDTPDYYNLQVLWDGSWGGTGDTFLNGSTGTVPYVEAICTGNTSKYRIHAQKGAQSIYSDEFTVTWTDDTTPPVPLTELSATITAPVAGATPVYTATTGSSDYTAEVISWYPVRSDGTNGSALMSTDVFEAGKKYAALVRFNANAGVTMDPDAAAVINGQDAVAAGFGIERDWVQFFAYFTVPEAQPTTYTVTFNMNGHGTAPATQTVNEGSKATKPAVDPTAEGWTFGGWYADATFNVAFDFNTAINADTTIYAKWTPVHTHNYISVVTNPTCTEKGYTTHTCACGDSYVDTYITATGHTYGEWTITKEPTETETGLKERTCTVCKQTKTETVPKLVKTYTPGDVDGDGKISAADARLALRRSVGLEDYKEGSDKFLACDVDFDGKVSAADARLILRASVGLENPKTWKKA